MTETAGKVSEDTLRLLYSLFISNVPQSVKNEWKNNPVRLFSELEWAHWFYLDNCLNDSASAGVDFYGFCQQMFDRFTGLLSKKSQWKDKFFEWKRYRGTMATGSAIILDEYFSMVLLVQGFNNDRWTFPGGKVNQGETLHQCAVREVMEETGLDIDIRLDTNLFIDAVIGETKRRSFIVEGLPRTTRLQPSTRNEIEAISWFNISNLPDNLQDETPMLSMKLKANVFYCVVPFVKQIRNYVRLRKMDISPMEALSKCEGLQSVSSQFVSKPVNQQLEISQPLLASPIFTPEKLTSKDHFSTLAKSNNDLLTARKEQTKTRKQQEEVKNSFSRTSTMTSKLSSASLNPTTSPQSPVSNTAVNQNKLIRSVQSSNLLSSQQLFEKQPSTFQPTLNFLRASTKCVTEPTIFGHEYTLDNDAFLDHFAALKTSRI